ncbi:hypothetical protein MTO96_007329 [Rhipicephalus appendiculatus]
MAYGYGQYQQPAAYPYPEYGADASSYAAGQSQTYLATGGGYDTSSVTGQQESSNRPVITIALLATFLVLMLVVCVGVVLAFKIGDTNGPTETPTTRREERPGGIDIPARVLIGPADPGQTPDMQPITTPLPLGPTQQPQTPMVPTSPPTPRRSGMMFCVVGDGLASADLFKNNLCDYIVYPDLVAEGGEFIPLLGRASWSVFQAGAKANPSNGLGLSFTPVGVGEAGSTLDSLPSMAAQLASFVQTMNVNAMGVLNFQRHLVASSTVLALAFQACASAVSLQTNKEAMVFLGVWLHKENIARQFASEVSTMAHVNTIIIQTHISVPFVLGHTLCISRPVSKMAANDITPQLCDKFRILFSSTLGVMVYVGSTFRNEPSGPYQGCDQSYMADWDFLCGGGAPLGPEVLDRAEMYAYIVYKDGTNQHFVSYETTNSLLDKMNLYIEKVSDGWAMFEAHRDGAKDCAIQEHFQRLRMVQFTARNRSRRGNPSKLLNVWTTGLKRIFWSKLLSVWTTGLKRIFWKQFLHHGFDNRGRSATSLALVVTFCILACVIAVGVLLAFTMGDVSGPNDGIESDLKGDDGKPSGTGGSGDEPVVMSPPAVQIMMEIPPTVISTPASTVPESTLPPAPISPPATMTPRRSGILFCVVGETFAIPDLFGRQLCNYIIYPDLVATGSTIVPIHGETSWQTFRMLTAHLSDIVRRLDLSALGVLDYPYHQGSSVKSLEVLFKALEQELVYQPEPVVFLGVWLIGSSLANDFVSQVATIKYVTTIILQTHVSPLRVPGDEVALQAVASLRSLGDKMRVVLSSTLGVMVYRGKPGSSQPTYVRQACENSWMVDSDFTCTAGFSSADELYDRAGLYAYVSYHNENRDYFLTWESEQSLQAKLDLYGDSSDGWALFEAHRDVWRSCGKNDDDYLRIAVVHQKARRPGSR